MRRRDQPRGGTKKKKFYLLAELEFAPPSEKLFFPSIAERMSTEKIARGGERYNVGIRFASMHYLIKL